jgi:hypothetical protein
MRLRDRAALLAATGLLYVWIHVVVIDTFSPRVVEAGSAGNDRPSAAKVDPVRMVKHVEVVDAPIKRDVGPLGVFHKLTRYGYFASGGEPSDSIRKQNSDIKPSADGIIARTRRMCPWGIENVFFRPEVWGFVIINNFQENCAMNFMGWSLPRDANRKRFHELLIHDGIGVSDLEISDEPCSQVGVKSFCLGFSASSRGSGRIFGSISGLLDFRELFDDLSQLTTHHCKLAVVDTQSDYADDGKSYIGSNHPFFGSSKFSRKFIGFILCVIGLPFSVVGQCALQWSGWNWPWSVAVILIWHGAKYPEGPEARENFERGRFYRLQSPR